MIDRKQIRWSIPPPTAPDREDQNTILLQEKVGNYVKCPQTHPERGLFSLFTKSGSREFKSGQSKGFLLCLRA